MCMMLRFVKCFGSEHLKFELGVEAHIRNPSPLREDCRSLEFQRRKTRFEFGKEGLEKGHFPQQSGVLCVLDGQLLALVGTPPVLKLFKNFKFFQCLGIFLATKSNLDSHQATCASMVYILYEDSGFLVETPMG